MKKKVLYSDAINLAFKYILKKYPESFIIGQGLWAPWYVGQTMKDLSEMFGKKRIIDSPVSEAGVTGIAIGASLNDMKPIVVHPRMDFMLLATDAIINQASKWKFMLGGANSSTVTIRSIINRGGEQGAQHSQSLYSMFANIPGIIVAMPSSPQDAFELLVKSVLTKSTVIYIDDRWLYSEKDFINTNFFNAKKDLLSEKSKVIKKGKDITLISVGYGIKVLKDVAVRLEIKNISSEIIDLRVINPLDTKTCIKSAIKTNKVLVLDYGWENCGISSEVVSKIAENTHNHKKKINFLKITLPNYPAPTNKLNEKDYYISPEKLLNKVIKHFF
jgi:pyruvate/2-oxoglutarate/acetoin dehydrogenase E1 component